MRLILVRHLEPLVEAGLCYGRLDAPLHPSAMEALPAVAAAPEFDGADCVWSSPARRCRALAQEIADRRGIPLRLDPRLLELDFGEWEGKAWASLDRTALDRWARDPLDCAPPGGESGSAMAARILAACDDLRRAAQTCVVVTHAGPLKILIPTLQGRSVDLRARSPLFGAIISIDCAPPARPDRPT